MKTEFLTMRNGLFVTALSLLLSACAPSSLNPLNQGSHSNGASAEAEQGISLELTDQPVAEHPIDDDLTTRSPQKPGDMEDAEPDQKSVDQEKKSTSEATTEKIEKDAKAEDAESYVADWDSTKNASEWTKLTLNALRTTGQDMVLLEKPLDIKEFCPAYAKLTYEGRLQFFVMLISAMARHESGFDPQTHYTEDFKNSDGKPVVSRGLLQMSLESARNYGCRFTAESQLHNVQKNLYCAVRILNRWISYDKKIGSWGKSRKSGEEMHLGGGRYWSVLRKTSDSRKQIQSKTKSLKICKN